MQTWLESESSSWLSALPSAVREQVVGLRQEQLLDAGGPLGSRPALGAVEALLCRQRRLLRALTESSSSDCLLANVPKVLVEYRQYPQQHALLMPLELFRRVIATAFPSCSDALRQLSCPSDQLCLIVCPARLPPDPHRCEKNDRLVAISRAVGDREYNQMVPAGSAIYHRGAVPLRPVAGGDAAPQPETLAVFMKDVSIGLDMRLMTIAGGIVGYYMCHTRGMDKGECIIGAGVAAVFMLFVDAILLVIRLAKEDLLKQNKIGGLVARQT